MVKYSFEVKLKIVQKYLGGEGGYTYLAKKYSIKNCEQIKNWVKAYKEFGEEELLRN